ncbi:MAG: thioredoxin family protein [Methylobacteriaceae bacterium]|nr:thioredoxin family protein [Methylobacteriaceae bacterium]
MSSTPSSPERQTHENVKILGSGCKRCIATADMATPKRRNSIDIELEKVTDFVDIAKFGIASTPGVVIDGKVVHAGGLPKPEDMAKWLAASLRHERSRRLTECRRYRVTGMDQRIARQGLDCCARSRGRARCASRSPRRS